MPLIHAPSGEELAKGKRDWKLLPEDEYIVEVTGIDIKKDQKNPYKPDEAPRDTWLVRLKVISFSNRDPLVYDDGSDPESEVKLTAFVDPNRIGLVPRASIFRKFATACLGIAIDAEILIESFSDLIGKRVIARTEHRNDSTGTKRDRVVDFRVLRQRSTRASNPAADAESLIAAPAPASDAEAQAKSDDIFGEEAGF